MKKNILKALLIILLSVIFSVGVSAVENGSVSIPREYYEAVEELPDEVTEQLPEGFFGSEGEDIGEAILEVSSPKYIFSYIGSLLSLGIGDAVSIAATLCGILVISAIFSALKNSIGSPALSKAIEFCSSCAIFSAIIGIQRSRIALVSDFFERVNSLMLGMIPVAGTVWAMGGNISTASVGSAGLYSFLTVSELFCAKTLMPVTSICIAFALCRTLSPELALGGFSSGIKKTYTFVLGFIMTVMVALLSAQTALSAAADGTAARAAKMVTSSMIPIVGGSVSETLRTVASSVQYIKTVVGVSGIIFLLMLLLPTLISLLLARLAFLFSGSVADLLGCERESRLIGELGSVYGCMIAVVSMCSVMFILALNIFIKTAVV